MLNPTMEAKVKELLELKRMKEELEAEIAAAEDEIKSVTCWYLRPFGIFWKVVK